MYTPNNPAELSRLRDQIRFLVDRIPDAATLFFCICIVNKIANREELPLPTTLRALRKAFVGMARALERSQPMKASDLALIAQHSNAPWLNASRCMARTVRYFRQRKGLTRAEFSRVSGIPARWLAALERGQLEDVSFAEVVRLADALGTTERAFLAEFARRLHSHRPTLPPT